MPEVREVSLGDGFGEVAVKANRARVEIHADGSIDAYTDAMIRQHRANDGHPETPVTSLKVKPGDLMDDGTIFVGVSHTGKKMFTTAADEPLTMKWERAMDYAAGLDAHGGYKDWRVPRKAELNVLYENRDKGALKGTFNVTGSIPAGWYWSSAEDGNNYAWTRRFSDGHEGWGFKDFVSSLRCVRG